MEIEGLAMARGGDEAERCECWWGEDESEGDDFQAVTRGGGLVVFGV